MLLPPLIPPDWPPFGSVVSFFFLSTNSRRRSSSVVVGRRRRYSLVDRRSFRSVAYDIENEHFKRDGFHFYLFWIWGLLGSDARRLVARHCL